MGLSARPVGGPEISGRDGVEKIQLRVDLGLLQMNARGRPDGKHPYGRESLLEFYQGQMEKFQKERRGDEKSFRLTPEDCARLQQEALQYHHRYICLFQLEEFDAVLRDTEPEPQGVRFRASSTPARRRWPGRCNNSARNC